MAKPIAPFFLFILLVVVAASTLVESSMGEKECVDRFASTDPASCNADCEYLYKNHLIEVIPPAPYEPFCICKFTCYQVGSECDCPPVAFPMLRRRAGGRAN